MEPWQQYLEEQEAKVRAVLLDTLPSERALWRVWGRRERTGAATSPSGKLQFSGTPDSRWWRGARDLLGDLAQVEQELVEQVLAYCPTPALLSARLVCRSWADLVAGSSWEPGTRLTRARLWQCWKGGPGLPAENLDLPPF